MNGERLVGAEEMRVNEGAIWFAPFLFAEILRPNPAREDENRQSSPSLERRGRASGFVLTGFSETLNS
jgi:hypothetical protein